MISQSLTDGGVVHFAEAFYSPAQADDLFARLKSEVAWKQETGPFGHPLPRLTAWYADLGVSYRYSGIDNQPQPWLPLLLDVKLMVEGAAQHTFNSLLLNYYRSGQDSIGYHADDEPELGLNPVIGSLSFGGARSFVLKHNTTKEKHTYNLTHGSLLIMAGTCQHFWKHALPKTTKNVGERINLTFRWTTPPAEA